MAHSETRIAGKYRQEQIIKILSLLGYFQGWATKNKWFATTTTHKKRKQKKKKHKTKRQPAENAEFMGKWLLLQKCLVRLLGQNFEKKKDIKNRKKKRHRPNA